MDSCHTFNHTARDQIHTDTATCNIEAPQQRYCPEKVSKRFMMGGEAHLNPLYVNMVFCHVLIYDLFAETAASNSFARIVLLRNY